MLTTNQIFCCDCLAGMAQMNDACIPLTVTSPPYGTMREYGGHGWDFPAVAKELYRITMTGGVLVWVVQEQIVGGSESGDSSRQRLHFMDLGFRCHQTLLMVRPGSRQYTAKRFRVQQGCASHLPPGCCPAAERSDGATRLTPQPRWSSVLRVGSEKDEARPPERLLVLRGRKAHGPGDLRIRPPRPHAREDGL